LACRILIEDKGIGLDLPVGKTKVDDLSQVLLMLCYRDRTDVPFLGEEKVVAYDELMVDLADIDVWFP